MKNKEKKYQISAQVLVAADGWVRAKNIEEAKKKWEDFCQKETVGLSYVGTEINEVVSPSNKYYDKNNVPDDKDFDAHYTGDCITYNYLN